jgi:hypothetical protein
MRRSRWQDRRYVGRRWRGTGRGALRRSRYGRWGRDIAPGRGLRARRTCTCEQRGNVLIRLGDDSKQLSHGNHFASLNKNLAQHAAAHRLDFHIDLVGLNLDDGFSSRNLVPFLLDPFEDLALCHRIAAFRHQYLDHC